MYTLTMNETEAVDAIDSFDDRVEHLEHFINDGISGADDLLEGTIREEIVRLQAMRNRLYASVYPGDR